MIRYLAAAAAFLTLALSGPASAQPAAGGGANVAGHAGFGCGPGMTYQMINGMARCQQPAPTAPTTASCSGTTLTSGSCSFTFPSSTSGTTAVAGNTTAGFSGSAQSTCSSGSWTGSSASCSANPCSSGTHSYGSCSFSVPALSSGTSAAMTNTTGGYTGSSTATCSAGTLSFSGEACGAIPVNCSGGTISWGASCSASVGATANAASVTLTNATSGYSGSAQFTCNNGSWAGPYTPSCTANPLPCSAGTVGWGSGCGGSLPATASGSGATVTNTTALYAGSATYACSNGGWTLGTNSCTPPSCPAAPTGSQTITCQAYGYAAGYTGSVTQTRTTTCDSSTSWAWTTGAWTTTSNTCIAPTSTCPTNIWVLNSSVSLPLTNSAPTDTLPNGHPYCLYSKTSGDRYAGVYDKTQQQAVDFFPIFQEVPDGTYDTTNSRYTFVGYEARYSTNLHVQGAYCANGYPSDKTQTGMYPGTCYNGGHGNFDRMCFIQMSPNSTVGAYMLAHGMGNRIAGGGSTAWGAYEWAPQYVDDGVNGWSMGAIYSVMGGLTTGGDGGGCVFSNPQTAALIPVADNPGGDTNLGN